MNILYINHYAGSPEMGMEFRPYYLAKEWLKMGHEVTIIAGDYSHLRRKNPKVSEDFQEEFIDGIRYVWLKTGEYIGNGGKRAFTMLRFVRKLIASKSRIVDTYRPDVVISSSTYPIDTFAAQKIAKKASAKLIHEVHDMWPATLIELGGMSKYHPFVVMMQIGENSAYRNSDAVVSLAPLAKEYMVEHGLKEENFYHIPNGISMDEWNNPMTLSDDLKSSLEELKAKGKFIVGYIGGHALSNSLEDLVEVAKKVKAEGVHFVLVGDGIEKNRLMSLAKGYELKNISFFNPIAKSEIPNLLKYFDCGYIGALPSPLYRFGTCMNKIFDYMAAGLPIICAITTPTSQVKEAECGICLDSGDIQGILSAISLFVDMDDGELTSLGEKGVKAMKAKYQYDALAKQFSDLFE